MKCAFFAALFLALPLWGSAHPPEKDLDSLYKELGSFPSYADLVDQFFHTYRDPDPGDDDSLEFKFIKKPGGWYVYLSNMFTGKVTYQSLYWSLSSKNFSDLDLARIPPEEDDFDAYDENVQRYLRRESFGSMNLFYGYAEWAKDVIAILGRFGGRLDNEFLYKLGRAYSSAATDLLWPRLSGGNYNRYDSTYDKSAFPPALLKDYMRLRDSCLACYQAVVQRDPGFGSFVGDMRTTLSNQYITGYYEMAIIGQEDLAKKCLSDGLYSVFGNNAARNILSSCDSNAIIYTTGDNDTYSLLYQQEVLHYRTDVTVIVSSFTQVGRYIHYLTSLLPPGKRLRLSLEDEQYKLDKSELIYTPDRTDEAPYLVSDLLAKVKKEELSRYDTSRSYTAPKVYKVPPDGYDVSRIRKMYKTDRFDTVGFHFRRQSYLFESDVFLMDLVSTNRFQRPIYFVNYSECPSFLPGHVQLQGMVYKLVPQETNEDYDLDKCFRNLSSQYSYAGLDSVLNETSYNARLASNYESTILLCTDRMIKAGEMDRARILLDMATALFGEKESLVGRNSYFFSEQNYRLGDMKKGDEWARKTAGRCKERFSKLLASGVYDNDKLVEYSDIVLLLYGLAKSKGRPQELIAYLGKMQKKMQEELKNN